MPAGGQKHQAVAFFVIGIILITAACTTVRVPLHTEVRALDDPRLIERGRYLVHGPAHCSWCHGDPARAAETRQGRETPLSGGRTFELGALGSIVAPNITSDPVAGVGAVSDATLVRSLRYGVSRHGEPLVPFMSFADLADADLQAILSYLRAVEPVSRPVPASDLNWLGRAVLRFMLDPAGPTRAPAARAVPERSVEYGRYLAHTVANCRGCHTRRSKLTGAFVGPEFAGGMELEEGGTAFISANLTPIPGGIIGESSEQQFITLFRLNARRQLRSPMPWGSFARMTDSDLGATYRFLKSLPPAEMPGPLRGSFQGTRPVRSFHSVVSSNRSVSSRGTVTNGS
jgi:mono/diheme cytochrome c family protein